MTGKRQKRFWKKLTALLRSGVPVNEALETLREEFEDTPLGDTLGEVIEGLEEGKGLAESLQDAGEELGSGLETMIDSIRDLAGVVPEIRRRMKKRRQVRKIRRVIRRAVDGEEEEDVHVEVKVRVREEDDDAPPAGVQELLTEAAKVRASDVHVDASETGGRIRFRVDGVLSVHRELETDEHEALLRELKRSAALDPAERRLPQDGRARWKLQDDGLDETLDVRVSIGPTVHGEAASLRLLRRSLIEEVLSEPGAVLQDSLRDTVLDLVKRPYGLFFVTGPTGSGKTSTIYSLLSSLDRESMKVMSVEDPVEVVLDGVHQIPVAPSRGLTFPSAIRHALRMDPDVLYCSEVRDVETATLLLKTALTGHLVFAGLHAPTAPDAVLRLLDIGLEPYLLADALIGVMGQRLIRRLDPATAVPAPEHAERLEELLGHKLPDGKTPMGPAVNGGTGFKGRVAVQELLQVTPEVRRVLQGGPSAGELEAVAKREGYHPMLENALERVVAGTTSLTEVLRVCAPTR